VTPFEGFLALLVRENDRSMLIAGRHQFEKVVCLLLGERGVAHFVDHQHTRCNVASQALSHEARVRCTFEGLCQLAQGRKEHRMSRCERLVGERQAQLKLTRFWG